MSLTITIFGARAGGLDSGSIRILGSPGVRAIDDGLIHHWSATLDPVGSGATLTDMAGAINGVIAGGAAFVADVEGTGTKAIQYAAVAADRIELNSINFPAAYSFSMWAKKTISSSTGTRYAASFEVGGGTMAVVSTDTIVEVQAGGNATRFKAGDSTLNEWFHVVFSCEINSVKTYLNAVAGAVNTNAPWNGATGNRGRLSNYFNDSTWFWGGRTDTIRIYDRILSPEEVTELYNAGRGEEFGGGGNPPVNTVLPSVTGSTVVGGTLTTTDGTWTNSPDDYAYEWERSADGSTGWESVPETNNTYVTDDPDDIGYYFRSKVTATNADGSASAYSNVVGPITDVAPTFKPHWALNRSRILGSGIR